MAMWWDLKFSFVLWKTSEFYSLREKMKEAAGGKVAGCSTFQTQSIVSGFLGHHDFLSMAILVKL